MKEGDLVKIIPSIALNELRLQDLAGISGSVVSIVYRGSAIEGCWIKLPGYYLHENEWFIPYSSISKL